MRIISGSARGTNLFTLEGLTTRPTLDRVRESLFNIIQNEIVDSIFLDLFSGSGAVGLEAASRGTKKSILCDRSKDAIKIINKNIEKTHLKEKIELYNVDYKELLRNKIKEKLDIIYIDPPYNSDFAVDAVKILIENNLLNKESLIIIETDREEKILKQLTNENLEVEIIDKRKYGRAVIIFLKLKECQN